MMRNFTHNIALTSIFYYRSSKPYEIEVFYQPDCFNASTTFKNNSEDKNLTDVYFYVKEDGKINPNITVLYPKDPTALDISEKLAYLKRKVVLFI